MLAFLGAFTILAFLCYPVFLQAGLVSDGYWLLLSLVAFLNSIAIALVYRKYQVFILFSFFIASFGSLLNTYYFQYFLVSAALGANLIVLLRSNWYRKLVTILTPVIIAISIMVILPGSSIFEYQYISTVRLQIIFLLLLIEQRRYLGLGIIVAYSLMVNGSRLGNLVGIGYILYFAYKLIPRFSKGLRFISTLVLLVTLIPIFWKVIESNARFEASAARSLAEEPRLLVYTKAFEVIKSSPIIGHGLGSYSEFHSSYPHNFLLQLMEDFGLFGLGLFFTCLVVVKKYASIRNEMYLVGVYLFLLIQVSMDPYKFVFFNGFLLVMFWRSYGKYFNCDTVVRFG